MPSLTYERLRQLFESSVLDFLREDAAAISINVSERNHCARLAHFLQIRTDACGMSGYFADVEWNRKQNGQVKTIAVTGQVREQHVIRITSDLLLHSRGWHTEADNLIAVEMKKIDTPLSEQDADRVRLKTLTKPPSDDYPPGIYPYGGPVPEHVCGYKLGAFMLLKASSLRIEYFAKGMRTEAIEVLYPESTEQPEIFRQNAKRE